MSDDMRQLVINEIVEVFEEEGVKYTDDLLELGVMELGVDSLTYAVLVARLEVKTGRDPFTEDPSRGYPKLLLDFVNAYLD